MKKNDFDFSFVPFDAKVFAKEADMIMKKPMSKDMEAIIRALADK